MYTLKLNRNMISSCRQIKTIHFLSLIGFLFLMPFNAEAGGCDVTVSNSTELQTAISNSKNKNKVVCLNYGTYLPDPSNRDISFNITVPNLTLRGLGTPEQVVLSGNIGSSSTNADNSQHVVTIFNQPGITLENLSIVDGYNTQVRNNTTGSGWGAGVLANNSTLTVTEVKLTNNEMAGPAGSGAALGLLNSSALIQNSQIYQNKATFAAVYSRNVVGKTGLSLEISNSEFSENTALTSSSAVLAFLTDSLTIKNSNFLNNTSNISEGAIRFDRIGLLTEGSLLIENTKFINNEATTGSTGALAFYGNIKTVISNTEFNGNHSRACGGAMNNFASFTTLFGKLTLTNSRFINNSSETCDGGAINLAAFPPDCQMALANNYFEGNYAGNSGGAMWLACQGYISNSKFINNNSVVGGGALTIAFSAISIDNSTFDSNVSDALGLGQQHITCDDPNGDGAISSLMNTLFINPNQAPTDCGL